MATEQPPLGWAGSEGHFLLGDLPLNLLMQVQGETGSPGLCNVCPHGFCLQISCSASKAPKAAWATLGLPVSRGLAARKVGKVRVPGAAGWAPRSPSSPPRRVSGSEVGTSPRFPSPCGHRTGTGGGGPPHFLRTHPSPSLSCLPPSAPNFQGAQGPTGGRKDPR